MNWRVRATLQVAAKGRRSHPPAGLIATPKPGYRCFPHGPPGPAICVRARLAHGVETALAASHSSSSLLVVPILLLVFAAAADLGRAFYAYIAIENGVKEGAFYGARSPLCTDDVAAGCGNPRNVEWRVRNELENLRNPDGTQLTPTVGVPRPGRRARPHAAMTDCAEGDTYRVSLSLPVPVPDADPRRPPRRHPRPQRRAPRPSCSTSPSTRRRAPPSRSWSASQRRQRRLRSSPTASSPTSSTPTATTAAHATTPRRADPGGHDLRDVRVGRVDPVQDHRRQQRRPATDRRHGRGLDRRHRLHVPDHAGPWATRTAPSCTYSRTAPNVPNGQSQIDYANVLTVDAAETNARAGQRHRHRPAAAAELEGRRLRQPVRARRRRRRHRRHGRLQERHRWSSQGVNADLTNESVWFQVVIQEHRRISRRPASRSRRRSGALPFGQNTANAVCDAAPTTMAAGATASPAATRSTPGSAGTIQNIVTVNSTNAVPAGAEQQRHGQLDHLRQPQPADPEPDRPRQGGRPGRMDSGRVSPRAG